MAHKRLDLYKIETEHNLESDLYQVSKQVALEQMNEEDVVNFLIDHVRLNITKMKKEWEK